MRKARRAAIVAIALVLVAGALIYSQRRPGSTAALVGVVRATEVRVEPEVNGQLVSITVEKGTQVHAGDVLARLSAVELTAQADQARAALASATRDLITHRLDSKIPSLVIGLAGSVAMTLAGGMLGFNEQWRMPDGRELALLLLRDTAAMGPLLALHLGVVFALFITMPYGKFVHGFYRFAALLRYAQEQRAFLSKG